MPCNTCNQAKRVFQFERVSEECDYTLDMLLDWKDKLICVKDKGIAAEIGMTSQQLNAFLGAVLSGTSFEYNICFLKAKLNVIQPYIIKIIDSGQC